MTQQIPTTDLAFTPFDEPISEDGLPARFNFPFDYQPHPLSILAAEGLQLHLKNQQEWKHNFGLTDEEGVIIGKMFGVLVVRTKENNLGYLSAFSGKLAGGNHHSKFVPPVFDGIAHDGFLNMGMTELTRINQEIRMLEDLKPEAYEKQVHILKSLRKVHSTTLQGKIFEQYHFINKAGEKKSLVEIFHNANYKNPPAGAGECAAPKLLQYAFHNKMKPIALAEFWWGLSPKSAYWQHGHFYPACREKCAPILAHMLTGTETDQSPDSKCKEI